MQHHGIFHILILSWSLFPSLIGSAVVDALPQSEEGGFHSVSCITYTYDMCHQGRSLRQVTPKLGAVLWGKILEYSLIIKPGKSVNHEQINKTLV